MGVRKKQECLFTDRELRKLKAEKYLRKYGFLLLKCVECGIIFSCSGHCIQKADLITFSKNGCYCSKCDIANIEWLLKCKKDDFTRNLIRRLTIKK